MRWYTMRVPSGDQRGCTWVTASDESLVACCGLRPRASTIQIRRGPAHDASTTIDLPSGETSGENALSTTGDSCRDFTSIDHTPAPLSYIPNTSLGCRRRA